MTAALNTEEYSQHGGCRCVKFSVIHIEYVIRAGLGISSTGSALFRKGRSLSGEQTER